MRVLRDGYSLLPPSQLLDFGLVLLGVGHLFSQCTFVFRVRVGDTRWLCALLLWRLRFVQVDVQVSVVGLQPLRVYFLCRKLVTVSRLVHIHFSQKLTSEMRFWITRATTKLTAGACMIGTLSSELGFGFDHFAFFEVFFLFFGTSLSESESSWSVRA